jgi:hypothetical protein
VRLLIAWLCLCALCFVGDGTVLCCADYFESMSPTRVITLDVTPAGGGPAGVPPVAHMSSNHVTNMCYKQSLPAAHIL